MDLVILLPFLAAIQMYNIVTLRYYCRILLLDSNYIKNVSFHLFCILPGSFLPGELYLKRISVFTDLPSFTAINCSTSFLKPRVQIL